MADDGSMNIRPNPEPDTESLADVARHELALTARAFFAPVVGTYTVMRGLLLHEYGETKRDEPTPKSREAA